MIVADTNLIAYFLIRGDRTPLARAAFGKDSEWVAPPLWRSEFRNVLALQVRQGFLSLETALEVAAEGEGLLEGNEYPVATPQVVRLAAASGRSAYDCEFVVLARELGVPLVTSDRRLATAFTPTAVLLDDYVSNRY